MSFEEANRPIQERWGDIVQHVKDEYLSTAQSYPWIVGFSGGKDSTVVAHAVFEALQAIPPSQRTRPVHIVSNDTMVESPLVMAHLDEVSSQIQAAVDSLNLPLTVARTRPDPDKTFWVLLIGKGYPSPNQQMRWCTDRLKIQPTSTYIKDNVSKYGAAVVVLGVRRTESIRRMRTVDKYENDRGSNLNPHSSITGAYIFRPIVELTTDDVWEILGSFPAPWGGTHTKLFQLYRDAEGGECPVVLSKDEAPGCGTKNSRFGCWTCTVVEKDKSLQGFVDSGQHAYKPLIAFRDWLVSIRNDRTKRSAIRRNGRLTFDVSGKHIPGPFTIQARQEILDRLLAVQAEFGAQLITGDELDLIHKYWAIDLQQEETLANA
ncbi:DNA phosphorothioation system sulfurtransferase DndC [Acidovorax sp. NCPPB 3859]|uniref:DNA phosphorothioation system sulfurtransferase DndC n=1 Tax=Paracidovorax avenae TaxID=80867 RepID=UPI001CEF7A3A|nr:MULTISPECIES: DNA phosphorothioation system sulfurtransferase DndC [Comamonadaceae]MDA8450670.1 DNA phosphorothioation system sulfurtransferase DndC [Acidovorax sp. GBBC 3297]MDA8460245.1 DNA phosphorothioation system sulfurtransferase DndC [Acidovorax sp. GBBC 3333]MDA8465151.1 DNA phosphorothioation system sulfurtransferase DndC [Acidovorax sp. GBBC 3332]MDA8470315.1 DNA phosphorothioation system sulfurtransferase DndC [Acidovorax sp. GBBC 3299]WCM80720.1 DNA phosphorothioation system sul